MIIGIKGRQMCLDTSPTLLFDTIQATKGHMPYGGAIRPIERFNATDHSEMHGSIRS